MSWREFTKIVSRLVKIKDVPLPAVENFTSILISAHVENFAKVQLTK